MNKPLLSIVIANYNYGHFLADAIESVIAQRMGDSVELIICDACSTDCSVDVIKQYEKNVKWWCSEKDGGQSAAFNKGFSHAAGRFLTWLNADDVLLPGTLEKLRLASERWPECEWFAAGCFWLDPKMKIFKCGRVRRMSHYRAISGSVNVCGPSSFFSRELYERVGKIDERFMYTMDVDLWLRFALQAHVAFKPFTTYGWGLRLHPGAKMSGHKFTADGGILEGDASREAFLKNESKIKQIELERNLMMEKFPDVHWHLSRFMTLLTADYIPAALSRYDTWRYRGRSLKDIFE
jgi:glycosyltransferase involved in cell wall biosynthesis